MSDELAELRDALNGPELDQAVDAAIAADEAPADDSLQSCSNIWLKAAEAVQVALEMVRERLVELRREREAINDEVRELVAEEERLSRMWRIAEGHVTNGS